MRFSSLSSGSKANCTFVEGGATRVLVDNGLSAKNALGRLAAIGIAAGSIDAILVTHEHSDHIRGIQVLSKQLKVPVWANERTREELPECYGFETFRSNEPFWLGGLNVLPVRVMHDAVEPVAFVFRAEGLQFAVMTDLGVVTPEITRALAGSHGLLLEANHDPELLQLCGYPLDLKRRIASQRGHLNNAAAGALLSELLHDGLRQVVLGHISENSNTPERALATVREHVADAALLALSCANPYSPTPLQALG